MKFRTEAPSHTKVKAKVPIRLVSSDYSNQIQSKASNRIEALQLPPLKQNQRLEILFGPPGWKQVQYFTKMILPSKLHRGVMLVWLLNRVKFWPSLICVHACACVHGASAFVLEQLRPSMTFLQGTADKWNGWRSFTPSVVSACSAVIWGFDEAEQRWSAVDLRLTSFSFI